jgi:hypothetical protein
VREVVDVRCDLADLAPARNAIVDRAVAWGVPVDPSVLALLAGEVVANAMEHGEPPIVAVVDWDERRLRVEVSDASAACPVRRTPSAGDAGGRGIWLVDRAAAAWGVDGRDHGKSVWFELRGAATAAAPCPAGA